MARAADRVLEALRYLADQTELGVIELSQVMQVDKSTAHRLLSSLTDYGFAVRVPESRRYRIGAEAGRVGYAYVKSHDLRRELLPTLQWLADRTGETVTLAIYDRGAAMILERVEGTDRVRTVSEVGMRAPIHAGASCKALLAHQSYTELDRVIREVGLPRLTPYTITDSDLLHADLADIRRNGYALSLEEVRLEHVGVGAPLFDYRGQCVAAISIAGPQDRFPPSRREQIVREVMEAARDGSIRLGYPVPVPSGH